MINKIVNTFKILLNLKNSKDEMSKYNKRTYESSDNVKFYSSEDHLKLLFKAEEVILKHFGNELNNMKMLDIGVGGGRTTYHFAHKVKEYIGIDYAENMVKACRKRFDDIHFEVCDVRSLNIFENNYFDFILFSGGGIDYISHEERIKALKEIKRICKNGAFFYFNVHNLYNFDKLFTFQFSANLFELIRNTRRYILFRMANEAPVKLKNNDYVTIRNYENRHKTYYIKTEEQIKHLLDLGFKNIRIYSQTDGKEIKHDFESSTRDDNWLYYFCDVP